MKKILIIYPHFPPSNLAGVHRARLFAQHLPSYSWEPVILTVHEKYYEEKIDYNLEKLLPNNLRIEKVKAIPIGKIRFVGDIGLRGFFQLHKKAKQLITTEHFDFLLIPIPSFYCALLGRWLHNNTGIKYGIDYIDPWVHQFPGSNKFFSRHWFSTKLAKILEPIAVKKASLITGVAEGYYKPVIERNPHLKTTAIFGAMPYGGEKEDHEFLKKIDLQPYLFLKKADKIQFVYAGAMLPKSYLPLEIIFKNIQEHSNLFANVEFHFIGTGKTANDPNGHNIKQLAEKYGLWQYVVFEYPERIPYLDVLVHLNHSDAIFILGSTEAHYTPSKSYQGILSEKPIFAVLHKESTAVKVLESSGAGIVLDFDGEGGVNKISEFFDSFFIKFQKFAQDFNPANVDMHFFNDYSAKEITNSLTKLLNKVKYS